MKPSHLLLATTAALVFGSSACRPKESASTGEDHTQPTAQLVADIVAGIKEDTGCSADPERILLKLKKPEIDALYKKLDGDPRTTTYYNELCTTYEQSGMERDLASRMADVVSHLKTFSDLVNKVNEKEGKLTSDEIRIILENNLVISGIHENEAPKIYTVLEGSLKDFSASNGPIHASISGERLTLTRGSHVVTLTVEHAKGAK